MQWLIWRNFYFTVEKLLGIRVIVIQGMRSEGKPKVGGCREGSDCIASLHLHGKMIVEDTISFLTPI